MKPILYETASGDIHPDVFDVMLDQRDEYHGILGLVVQFNEEQGRTERAEEIKSWLADLDLSVQDSERHFIITGKEAKFVESHYAENDPEKERRMKCRLQRAVHLVLPLSLGMHHDPSCREAYAEAEYELRPVKQSALGKAALKR